MRLSSIGWNVVGLLSPVVAALVCVPWLLSSLGSERFGLLSLAWALTAMAGLFDLGVGRAATRMAADRLGSRQPEQLPPLARLANSMAWRFGCLGAVVMALVPCIDLVERLDLRQVTPVEVNAAAALLALAVPFQAVISVHRGLSEAQQRFRAISIVRMLVGVAHFVAPLAVAQLTTNLAALVGTLLGTRILAWMAFRRIAMAHVRDRVGANAEAKVSDTPAMRRELLRSGGWLTASGVVSPLMVHADRFFIAAILSAAAVPGYTVPFELVTQLLLLTTAISTVAFPTLAQTLRSQQAQAWSGFDRWRVVTSAIMGAACLIVAYLLPIALPWWVGGQLPDAAVTVGQVLCLGVWVNSVGVLCYSMLHAIGRFRDTALLHLTELPVYVGLLVLLTLQYGIVGSAVAWVLRVALDTSVLMWLVRRHRPSALAA